MASCLLQYRYKSMDVSLVLQGVIPRECVAMIFNYRSVSKIRCRLALSFSQTRLNPTSNESSGALLFSSVESLVIILPQGTPHLSRWSSFSLPAIHLPGWFQRRGCFCKSATLLTKNNRSVIIPAHVKVTAPGYLSEFTVWYDKFAPKRTEIWASSYEKRQFRENSHQ